MIVSVRHNTAPRNLANAFELAVRAKKVESLTRKSAEELVQKAHALQVAFGGDEQTFVLNLIDAKLNGVGTPFQTLKDLLDKVILTIQE